MFIYPIPDERVKKFPFYITGIGKSKDAETIFRPEGYESHQISLITNGEGYFECNGVRHEVKSGDLFFFRKNIPHAYYISGNGYENRWICFESRHSDFLEPLSPEKHPIISLKDSRAYAESFDRIYEMVSGGEMFYEEESSLFIYQAVMDCLKLRHISGGSPKKEMPILVREYIQKNFTRDISLNDIAEHFGISKYTLARIYKDRFRTTIFSHIMGLRIQKSKSLLIHRPELSTSKIALMCGFNDASYFHKVFKDLEKMTPNKFRKLFIP